MPNNDLPDAPWVTGSLPDAPWASTPQGNSGTTKVDERGVLDKLLGVGGPRFQTFPERAVRGIGSQIEQFMAAGAAGPPGSREVTQAAVGPAAEVAMAATPLGPESRVARTAVAAKPVIPEERQAAADILKQHGIEVSAGQARGASPLRTAESALGTAPFSGDVAGKQAERQMRQFTKAALSKIGEDSDRATPEVIDQAFRRIGSEFDRLEQHSFTPDDTFKSEIAKINQEYEQVTSPGTRVPYVGKIAEQVEGLTGDVSGRNYKVLRSEMNRVMRKTTNPEQKEALSQAIEALDGAMERTLEKTNPAELEKWSEARRQYRNLMVIEKALPAGEAGAAGLITPAKLRQAAMGQSRRAFRRGQSEFTDLANAGEQLLTPVKTSKTSERMYTMGLPAEAAGAAALAGSGHLAAAGTALTAMFGPGIAGRILMSPAFQNWMKSPYRQMQRSGTIPQELAYRGGVEELLSRLGSRTDASQ